MLREKLNTATTARSGHDDKTGTEQQNVHRSTHAIKEVGGWPYSFRFCYRATWDPPNPYGNEANTEGPGDFRYDGDGDGDREKDTAGYTEEAGRSSRG